MSGEARGTYWVIAGICSGFPSLALTQWPRMDHVHRQRNHFMLLRILLAPVLAFAFILTSSTAGQAAPIVLVHDADSLASIDLGTGAVTAIGSFGAVSMTDIAVGPGGQAYGLSASNFYSIDLGTGTASLVGAHGISSGNSLAFGSDGTLWAASASLGRLYTINTATGASTWTAAVNTSFGAGGDIAQVGGLLYLTESGIAPSLWSLDPSAVVSPLASIGVEVGAIGFPDVWGMVAVGSTLYGFSNQQVVTIDPTTGAGTLFQDYTFPTVPELGVAGVSKIHGAALLVPEPSLATALLAAGAFAWARRARDAR